MSTIKDAYKRTLDEIEINLKGIHSPLCDMEKHVFDCESNEMYKLVQDIHNGYMQIQQAINKLRKVKGIDDN